MATLWFDSSLYDEHNNGPGHPERPERLTAVREGIAKRGLEGRLERREAGPVDRALLERLHDPKYVSEVEALCQAGGGRLDADTAVAARSWDAALRAAGSVVEAVDAVLDASSASSASRRAFCSVRPPGHHAERARGMGFCLFDNVAVGAEHALARGVPRIAIIDWDAHHGNGTQDLFWRRGDVLYASWHQYPFYPGTGALSDVGEGPGQGTTVNCPIAAGEGDAAFLNGWETQIRPALERFEPELLIISAGFDADERDPLAGLCVTPQGFSKLSESVMRWADSHTQGRVVSVLEGGYALDALAEDVALHLETLAG
jgi:acetoin utilization deacetylase AcuC-like enzyme